MACSSQPNNKLQAIPAFTSLCFLSVDSRTSCFISCCHPFPPWWSILSDHRLTYVFPLLSCFGQVFCQRNREVNNLSVVFWVSITWGTTMSNEDPRKFKRNINKFYNRSYCSRTKAKSLCNCVVHLNGSPKHNTIRVQLGKAMSLWYYLKKHRKVVTYGAGMVQRQLDQPKVHPNVGGGPQKLHPWSPYRLADSPTSGRVSFLH